MVKPLMTDGLRTNMAELITSPTYLRARVPVQERSQQRVSQILAAAEELLVAVGPEETSIPEISKLTGIPRASIYQFYANKYVLFNQIAEHYLGQVSTAIGQMAPACHALPWREAARLLIEGASEFYNRTPVASILVLGGPMSRRAYQAQEITIHQIGQDVRNIFGSLAQPFFPPLAPDTTTYATEIAFACMRLGYYEEGRISQLAQDQAVHAATAYLSRWA